MARMMSYGPSSLQRPLLSGLRAATYPTPPASLYVHITGRHLPGEVSQHADDGVVLSACPAPKCTQTLTYPGERGRRGRRGRAPRMRGGHLVWGNELGIARMVWGYSPHGAAGIGVTGHGVANVKEGPRLMAWPFRMTPNPRAPVGA